MKQNNSRLSFRSGKLWLLALVITALALSSTLTKAQTCDLVVNGNFAAAHSCPSPSFTSDYACDPTATINGPGNYAVTSNAALWNGPWNGVDRLGGTNFLIADGGTAPRTRLWIQNVNVVAGQKYTYTIWARNIVNAGSGAGIDAAPGTVSIRVNNVVLATTAPLMQAAANVWTQLSATYTATTTGAVTLDVFQNLTNGYNDVAIDDISFVYNIASPVVTNRTICPGHTSSLTASGGPAGSVYVWYNAATGGSPIFTGATYVTPVLTSTTTYWVAIRNTAGCEGKRTLATVTVNPAPAAPIVPKQVVICSGNTATINASGAASGEVYEWYASATGGNPIFTGPSYTTPVLTANTSYWVDVRNPSMSCPSIRVKTYVMVNPIPTAPIITNPTVCKGSSATITAPAAPTGYTYEWYTSATMVKPLFKGNPFTTPVLNANTSYWVLLRSSSGCASTRVKFTVTMMAIPAAPNVTNATICGPGSVVLRASGGAIHTWYPTASSTTPIFTGNAYTTPVLNTTTSYWVTTKNAAGCESARVQVTATVNDVPDAPTATGATRCGCGTLTLTALGTPGTYNWYANPAGGAILGTGTSFTTPNICNTTNYYVSITGANGCASPRVLATATVIAPVNLVTNGNFAAPNSCPQTGFTFDYTCDANAPINQGGGFLAVTNNAATWNGPWWGTNRSGDGTNFLIADGTSNANRRIWRQNVNVVAGQQYTFSIWVRNLVNPGSGAGVDPAPGTVSLRVNNGIIVTSPVIAQSPAAVWM